MKEQTTNEATASRVVWENLEEFARSQIQEWLQALLEAEGLLPEMEPTEVYLHTS